ncbi:MAG: nucleotidyltransferase domain-containing protein [Candidatus Latescibacter sp.]|nr:nucleotidyltransferase domain-containing protein [Candidatus Latescibacter sp.]
METIQDILNGCKTLLEHHYGAHFKGLVLYGSTARDQAGPESDIDLLVLLDEPIDYFLELRRIIEILYPLQLETDRLISVKPVFLTDFEQGRFQLFRNAKREGVLVI